MALDISERMLIRKFQRRRYTAAFALLVSIVGIVLLARPLLMALNGAPFNRALMVMIGQSCAVIGFGLLWALAVYKCTNCHGRPYKHDGFSWNPRRCGACKMRLRLPTS